MNFPCGLPEMGVGDVGRGWKSLYPPLCVQGGCGTFQRRLGGVYVAGAASGGSRHQEMALRCILRPQGRGLRPLWCWHQIGYDTVNLSSLISSLK